MEAYYSHKQGNRAVDSYSEGDNTISLASDGNKAILMETDDSNQLKMIKDYTAVRPGMEAASLIKNNNDTYIFYANRLTSSMVHLLKTGKSFNIDCAVVPATVQKEDATQNFKMYEGNVQITIAGGSVYPLDSIPATNSDYPLQLQLDCRKACCENKTDTAAVVNICNTLYYKLPNGDTVNQSGIYYVNYKNPRGCDSTVFYPVYFLKAPYLSPMDDVCLDNKDSIILTTIGGYSSYNWMGNFTTDSFFVATRPGVYWVDILNRCGSVRDSIEVFGNCNFPIYIPSAFTPNGDGINDDFGFPSQNQNTLLQLLVYNRWCQLVFNTNNKHTRWNGTFKNSLQPAGTYIYSIHARALNGKLVSARGSFQLIR